MKSEKELEVSEGLNSVETSTSFWERFFGLMVSEGLNSVETRLSQSPPPDTHECFRRT